MPSPTLSPMPVPLRTDEHGALRVGSSRVTLETLVAAYHSGYAPEEIVEQYPSLDLADVYASLAYYLRQRSEVDAYLRARSTEANALAARCLDRQRGGLGALRARLEARRREAST